MFISSVLFPVCGLLSFARVMSVYCLERFLVYIHIPHLPSLTSVLLYSPYLFLKNYFIPHFSYLESLHCPRMISPIPIFITPFSLHVSYVFFPQSVFNQRIRCFYFFRKLASIFLIVSLFSFTGALLFSVFFSCLCSMLGSPLYHT